MSLLLALTGAPAGTHNATGALSAPGAALVGSAQRVGNHAASGVLVGAGGVLAGSAARVAGGVTHDSTGALANPGGVLVGAALRTPAAVNHAATGALGNPGAVLVGFAANESAVVVDTHDGFWADEYRKMWRWGTRKPTTQELVEFVEEEPEQALQIAQEVAPQAVVGVNPRELRNNTQAAEFLAAQLLIAIELRQFQVIREADEDDIESLLLLA